MIEPAPPEIAPLRLPLENPPWTLWDVLRLAALALVAVFLFVSLALSVASVKYSPKAPPTGFERDPLIVVPAEFAAYVLLVAFMAALVRARGLTFWRAIKWNFPYATWAGYLALGAGLAIGVQAISALLPVPKQLPIDNYFRSAGGAYLMAFFGVAIAPFVEELFFRGFLYPVIARKAGMAAGVVITAILFAFIHESQLAHAWAPLLMLFVVGTVLTLVRARLMSVASSWLMHTAYNATLFTLLFIASDHFRHLEKLS